MFILEVPRMASASKQVRFDVEKSCLLMTFLFIFILVEHGGQKSCHPNARWYGLAELVPIE